MRYLRALLLCVPLAFLADSLLHNALLSFVLAGLGLVALSAVLGEAIESLAAYTRPQVAALLNATLGNAAELIITIVALRAGQVALVQASITGAILGNLLVVPGLGMLVGGLKYGRQYFDRDTASVNSTLMSLSVVGLFVPTLFEIMREVQRGQRLQLTVRDPALDELSLGFAVLLILVYLLSLVYAYSTSPAQPVAAPGSPPVPVEEVETEPATAWSLPVAAGVLLVSSIAMIFLSDVLVGAVEQTVKHFGLSEVFLGVILIPLVGDVAEHLVAVQQAYKNHMDLALGISLGSGAQIALFVAPLLVIVSRLFGHEMTLFFSPFEVLILGVAVYVAGQIAVDGESNWLEGVQLLVLYLLAAFSFFLL